PQARQRGAEAHDVVELPRSADPGPVRVVTVLLAAARVAAGRLQVPARRPADPDIRPGRRDRQAADALERRGVAHRLSVASDVAEAATCAPPPDAGRGISDVPQARFACVPARMRVVLV